MGLEFLELYLSPGGEPSTHFKVFVSRSSVGEQEEESLLPFIEIAADQSTKDWFMTLIKVLESSEFDARNFQQEGELNWLSKCGFLSSDRTTFHPELYTKIGFYLYQALFPSKIEKILQGAISVAGREHNQLHIQLKLAADVGQRSHLPDYPWELVYDGRRFLAHHGVIFSRYIAYEAAPPNLPPVDKVNVLFISSSATDPENGLLPLPDMERDALWRGLRQASRAGHIRLLEGLPQPTFNGLRAYLTQAKKGKEPHVLHFDGHGLFGRRCHRCRTMHRRIRAQRCRQCDAELPEPQGYLLFESDTRGPDYAPDDVSAAEFGSLLHLTSFGKGAQQSGTIAIAVLSACQSGMALASDTVFSGVAQNLINHNVPAVVAMQYSVSVAGAAQFTEQFYRALGEKCPLAVATGLGREAMGVEHNQWYRPTLYLRWWDNEGGQLFDLSRQRCRLQTVMLTNLSITAVVLVIRLTGVLQPVELMFYDHFIRTRGDEGPDGRVTVVQVTQADLDAQPVAQTQLTNEYEEIGEDGQVKRSLSNDTLTVLLERLNRYQPRVIGLDLERPGSLQREAFSDASRHPKLLNYLQQPHLFAGCKARDDSVGDPGYKAPAAVPIERVGFNDAFTDDDGILRRQLLAFAPDSNSPCAVDASFSLRLVGHYLAAAEIQYEEPLNQGFCQGLRFSNGVDLTPFLVRFYFGGYQREENYGGCQVLLNYRSSNQDPSQAPVDLFSLDAVLKGDVPPEKFHDRIVLIGIAHGATNKDYWSTPYGLADDPKRRMPGVIVQSQMISQLVSAVLGERSLIWVWPLWGEAAWIWVWSLVGGLLVWRVRSPLYAVIAIIVAGTILYFICLGLFYVQGWIPFFPAVMILVITGAEVGILTLKLRYNRKLSPIKS
jgi:CHASE2 domain-containing sensor protein